MSLRWLYNYRKRQLKGKLMFALVSKSELKPQFDCLPITFCVDCGNCHVFHYTATCDYILHVLYYTFCTKYQNFYPENLKLVLCLLGWRLHFSKVPPGQYHENRGFHLLSMLRGWNKKSHSVIILVLRRYFLVSLLHDKTETDEFVLRL